MKPGLDTLEWIRDAAGNGRWSPRPGVRGFVDLRPLPDQQLAGEYGERPYVLAIYGEGAAARPSDSFVELSPRPGAKQLDAWESLLGYRPAGETLAEIVFDHLTLGADPAGLDRSRPILPGVDRWLRLRLAGEEIASHKLHWGDRYTNRIAAVLQADFRRRFAADPIHARKSLDYDCEKLRLVGKDDWQSLVPSDLLPHVAGRLKHDTTITESWPTNSTTISSGQDQPWSETAGDSQVAGGRWTSASAGNTAARARCDSAVSGADHYAQSVIHVLATGGPRVGGVLCRFDGSAENAYQLHWTGNTGNYRLGVLTGGSATDLGTGTTQTVSLPATIKIEADGSTIRAYFNGALVESLTDTTHAGYTRGGLYVQGNNSPNAAHDSYEISDLAPPAAGQPTMRRWGGAPGMRLGGQPFGRSW